MSSERTPLMANGSAASTSSGGGGGLFGWMKQAPARKESSWDKSKVDPKVFFGNERTFLAWVHVGVVLAGMSVALVAATENHPSVAGQIYGILLLPVAIAFIVYSMSQCKYSSDLYISPLLLFCVCIFFLPCVCLSL